MVRRLRQVFQSALRGRNRVAAVTQPGERTFALGVTGVVRNVGWAGGPLIAGWTMSALRLGAPLVLGAGLKIAYDLALYASYRHIRPPEEAATR